MHSEEIMAMNTYSPNNAVTSLIKHKLHKIQGETDRNTVIIGDFNTSLSLKNKSKQQQKNKQIYTI